MREIYLDNAATTKVSESAAETAMRMMTLEYGNPSSLHSKGFKAERELLRAREQISTVIGAQKEEIIFCSGGTEANNLAILGAAKKHSRRGKTIITTPYEHSSVYETAKHLESQGFTVRFIPPGEIAAAADEDTILVSCMAVNSETGAVTDVAAIAAAVKRKNPQALFHTDAVQAFGKLPVTIRNTQIDMMSISGHKIHAPKGSGALFIRRGVKISPAVHGGGHENGLRAGTQSTPLCCAFGTAAGEAHANLDQNLARVTALAAHFRKRAGEIPGLCVNSPADGSPYIQHISLPGYISRHLMDYLSERGIYVSAGTACGRGGKSRVLDAMNMPQDKAQGALRISFCRDNTTEEADAFFAALTAAVNQITKRG